MVRAASVHLQAAFAASCRRLRAALYAWAVSPNVLNRQFEQTEADRAWVCDITYIRTCSGWLYLAAAWDLHSRRIVGWVMAADMQPTLVTTALQIAIAQRNPRAGLIVHSDGGTQYASRAHQAKDCQRRRLTAV